MLWEVVLLAAGIMGVLAVGAAFVLGWADRVFHVEIDPRVEGAIALLPGANCGGCGYVGCQAYGEAVASGEAVTKCTVGGPSVARALGAFLGVEVQQTWPYRAVVHCAATSKDRLKRNPYYGVQTCAAANMISGIQGCTYGCLGLGDCVAVCEYDALYLVEGLPRIDYDNCTGCGACVRACPRHIISRVPFKAERMLVVSCSNEDSGRDVSAVCTVGCIGCSACAKLNDLVQIDDNLAQVDYDRYDPEHADFSAALQKCPRESLVFVGKPTEKDLMAVAEEGLPARVGADFKTTVDDAEWRG